jgi:hypothetical protein
MPKTMKQEWSDGQAAFQFQGYTPMSSPMSYASALDGHPVWNAGESMQGSEYWPVQLEQQQQQQQQQHQMPVASSHQTQPQCPEANGVMHQQPSMMPHAGVQQVQIQQPMQMMSQGQFGMDASSPMTIMQTPQMQMHMASMALASGDSTPTEFSRCMAIVMPDTALFSHDKNMVAAQLQAAADCQRYED